MLRPRRPWMVPVFNRSAGTNDGDHLRDDVVAMFRDSFDEDGLDFLKRGPRTPRERLAYAQRVRPDAHLSAQPAPSQVQRRLADHGVVDPNRYFVGPDRRAYPRGERTAELAPAATRRELEAAVGGFTPASFDQALAELDGTGRSVGPSEIESMGYLGDEQPVPPGVRLTDEAEQAIDEVEQRHQDYAEYGRRHGHDEAAAAMERFLSGSGKAMRLDPSWLRSTPSVREAERVVRQHFQE